MFNKLKSIFLNSSKLKSNKKGFSLFEMVIVIGLVGAFSIIIIGYQTFILQKNNFLDATNKLALSETTISQLLDRYLKDANEIVLYNNHLDSSKNIDGTIYHGTSFYLDDLKYDGTNNACKQFDLENYDLIGFASDNSIDPIILGIKKEIIGNKDLRTIVVYKYYNKDEAVKKGVNYFDSNNKTHSTGFSNSPDNSIKCKEFSIALLDTWRFTDTESEEKFYIPNFKIPKGGFNIEIPSNYLDSNNRNHGYIDIMINFQMNYTYQLLKKKIQEQFNAFYILQ